MGKRVNLVFHAWVIVEGVAVKVAELRGVSLKNGASKGCGNVGFYKGNPFKGDQDLEMLDKQHYVPVVNVFANWHNLVLTMHSIEMEVEIAKIGLILSISSFWLKNRWG